MGEFTGGGSITSSDTSKTRGKQTLGMLRRLAEKTSCPRSMRREETPCRSQQGSEQAAGRNRSRQRRPRRLPGAGAEKLMHAAVFVLCVVLRGSLALADSTPMFQGPPEARERFLKGRKLPLVCKPDGWAAKHPEALKVREWMGPEHPSIGDASSIVKQVHDTVGSDVILTRENLDRSWVTKLDQDAYKWELGALPHNMRIALAGNTRFKSCALVGSSGHLKSTSFGHIIDQFDAVARANQSPTTHYEKHTGSKTTLRFINEAIARQINEAARRVGGLAAAACQEMQYQAKKDRGPRTIGDSLRAAAPGGGRFSSKLSFRVSRRRRGRVVDEERQGQGAPGRRLLEWNGTHNVFRRVRDLSGLRYLCQDGIEKMKRETLMSRSWVKRGRTALPIEQGVALVQVSEFKTIPQVFMGMQHHIKLLRQDAKVLMVPNTVTYMTYNSMDNWADRMVCKGLIDKKGGARPTTGFQMAMVMLQLCDRVALYGFGPSAQGQQKAAYHFFQGSGRKTWGTTSAKVHNFEAENLFWQSLAEKGLVTICNDGSEADCGLDLVKAAADAREKEKRPPQRGRKETGGSPVLHADAQQPPDADGAAAAASASTGRKQGDPAAAATSVDLPSGREERRRESALGMLGMRKWFPFR